MLLAEEEDASLLRECETVVADLKKQLEAAELKAMLSGESDGNNAILAINSGAGGTESQDWAEMLLRMYIRWGERNDYKLKCSICNTVRKPGSKAPRSTLPAITPTAT